MNPRKVGTPTHPLLALGMIPERAHHVPARAMVARTEQAAGLGATPDDAGLVGTACRKRPDARRRPGERAAPHVVFLQPLGFGRIDRRRNLLPAGRSRAVQLDAEVAM